MQSRELSPFHEGEKAIQIRTGRRDAMEAFGRKVIRSFLPDQHRAFFAQLPFLVVGSVDEDGWPWASIVSGKPGFLSSPDPTQLVVSSDVSGHDPLAGALRPGAPLGLLGIETTTRRRNRLNARVNSTSAQGFSVLVDQSFGNCPQYIQTRSVDFVRDPATAVERSAPAPFSTLDHATAEFIREADTFYVASFVQAKDRPDIEGVDVSHRGGRKGFVKVDGNTLTVPDYSGNYHFNTLGNFLLNPKAGLIFADFETGDVVMLTGTVELLWEDAPEIMAFKGAERGWRFTLVHGLRIKDALPFRSVFGGYSPNSLMAGDWAQTMTNLETEKRRNTWRAARIAKIVDESSVIRSFYFDAADGAPLAQFLPGQFLTLRVAPNGADTPMTRTYTVSSAPGEAYYRISVKREPGGVVSNHLHDCLQTGDVIELKAPRGVFTLDAAESRPAVLLAGGVGITPMIAMAQHVFQEGQRTRHTRSLTILHSAQTTDQRAFSTDFRRLERQSEGAIRYFSLIDQPGEGETLGADFDGAGYITEDVLRQVLSLDDYDFYLCGPPGFMQGLYDALRRLGVRDIRINAEAFGPASLKRQTDTPAVATLNEADNVIVKFTKSKFEQPWTKGDVTLLETAEAHGLTPDFGCRTGTCGSCAVRMSKGSVVYRTEPSAEHGPDEVLICCAVPAHGTDQVELDL